MRILLLLSRIEQTGVTTHTLDLAEGLISKGHEVCLITGGIVRKESNRVRDFYSSFEELGVTIKEFKTPNGNLIVRSYQTIISIINILNWIYGFKPNVIHSQSPYMTFIPWLMGKKYTTTLHQVNLIPNIKFKNPTHLIAISKESYDFSKRVFKIKDRDISIIHHGVSERYASPIPKEEQNKLKSKYGIAEKKVVLGFVGSISLRKGSDILVKALKNVNKQTSENIHFIFLGGNSYTKEYKWLKELITDADISNFVTMVPFEDPKPFYDIFDIFVLPSRMESFPLATLEAMMSNCCVVRSNTEGAYEQIEDGVNGLLFSNENDIELTKCLEKVINNKKLREQLSANAKKKALQEFTIPVMTNKTLGIYNKIFME